MRKGGTLYYLHADQLGSIVMTTEGTTTVDQLYCAYGRQRTVSGGVSSCPGGNSLPTGHTFTGQKLDGTGLQYYNARYYDPAIGTFISPDTIVPDATNVFDYNRYMYTRGNPLKYNDPSGHETNKPDWWPDFLPYTFDLPDGMTQPDFIEWLGENNIPTTWGVQVGGDATLAPYVGFTGSFEGGYIFNWLTGETFVVTNISIGGYGGLPDAGFDVHGGGVIIAGASQIERSVLGLFRYTAVSAEAEAVAETGVSFVSARGVKNQGNSELWVPGQDYIDPQFDRTVDALSINVSLGGDILSGPVQGGLPVDGAVSHGYGETKEVFSFNLYQPFQALWNWVRGN